MRFTEHSRSLRALTGVALAAVLAACAPTRAPAPAPEPAAPPVVRPAQPSIPAPSTARNWDQMRRQMAERMVAANPDMTYMGKVPEPLLAIPVLEIELNADGSVRNIVVMREPRQAKDTIQLAMNAVRRGAPYGNVSHLPRPWKVSEVFLFDDNRRFKPRTLDN